MSLEMTGNVQNTATFLEHDQLTDAKRIVTVDSLTGGIPYDYGALSNADVNGNYQTITLKTGGSSGATIGTIALTFDGNSNITSFGFTKA